jgi:hypothetical protein
MFFPFVLLDASSSQAPVVGEDVKWLLGAICFLVVSYGVFMAKKIFDHEQAFFTRREATTLENTLLMRINLILDSNEKILKVNVDQTAILAKLDQHRRSEYPTRDDMKTIPQFPPPPPLPRRR